MPFKSQAQRGYLHIHEPEIAKKWDKEFPNQKGLPEKVGMKKEPASDNAAFDVHATDPMRLRKELKKDLGVK